MKTIRPFFYAIFILLISFPSFAQDNSLSLSLQLKQNIQIAFDHFKLKDTISIESQLEEEIMEDYYLRFLDLNPKDFDDEYKAIGLIQYYLTPDGIEDILRQWKMQTDSLDQIYPIGNCLYQKIYLASEKTDDIITKDNIKPDTTAPDIPANDSLKTVGPLQKNRIKKPLAKESRSYEKHVLQKFPQKKSTKDEIAIAKLPQKNMEIKNMETVTPEKKTMEKERVVSVKPNMNEFAIEKHNLKTIERERMAAVVRLQNTPATDTLSNRKLLMLTFNTKNKYATLIINEPDKPDAEIYLDGKFIDALAKIKNGILVRSRHLYEYEIRDEAAVYCKDTITLAPKEKRTTKCSTN